MGIGPEGSATDYAALCAHPFFQCEETPIHWGRLVEETAPFIPDPSTFPSTASMRDGADDEWLSDGEATPIDYNPIAYKKGSRPDHEDGSAGLSRGVTQSSPGGSAHIMPLLVGRSNSADNIDSAPRSKSDTGRYWDSYLTLGEEHVFGGTVWKRKVCLIFFLLLFVFCS